MMPESEQALNVYMYNVIYSTINSETDGSKFPYAKFSVEFIGNITYILIIENVNEEVDTRIRSLLLQRIYGS